MTRLNDAPVTNGDAETTVLPRAHRSRSVVLAVLSRIVTPGAHARILRAISLAYSRAAARGFASVGGNCFIEYPAVIRGSRYISVGDNFEARSRLRLEAYDEHRGLRYQPCVEIGHDVALNYDCHIGCVNLVRIGSGVLIASRVYITDHSHGEAAAAALLRPPALRPVTSKGPVIIDDNVWIGEGAAILPNVHIGQGAIVGANAVVTKNVPARAVVAGAPARVIRLL